MTFVNHDDITLSMPVECFNERHLLIHLLNDTFSFPYRIGPKNIPRKRTRPVFFSRAPRNATNGRRR